MKILCYILGFVICMHFNLGCKERTENTEKENQKFLELRIADVIVVDNSTHEQLMMTNGCEIIPAEGVTYPRVIEMPWPSKDLQRFSFRMSWIANSKDTETVTVKANGYKPKTLSLDQVLRINSDKMTDYHRVELRMEPIAEQAAPSNR